MTSGRHGTSEAWLGDASPSPLVGRSGRSCTCRRLGGGKGRMPLYTRTYQSEGVRLAPALPPLDLPPIPCMLLTG